jgi:predicted PurR-regulated permease PerM
MTASSFLSDFESHTGLSFWLFLLIMAGAMAANSVVSRWRRRRFAGLYRPSNLLLMFVLFVMVIVGALFANSPSDIGKQTERSSHTPPPPKSG